MFIHAPDGVAYLLFPKPSVARLAESEQSAIISDAMGFGTTVEGIALFKASLAACFTLDAPTESQNSSIRMA